LRQVIVQKFERLVWAMPTGVVIYGIVLLVGDRILGIRGNSADNHYYHHLGAI
jgi:hypothetical protein